MILDDVMAMFQSTLPCGERLPHLLHAPLLFGFNPRSRAGSDEMLTRYMQLPLTFQSTLPCGERPGTWGSDRQI